MQSDSRALSTRPRLATAPTRPSARSASDAPDGALVWRIETPRFLAQTRIPLEALTKVAEAGNGVSAELSDLALASNGGLQLISLAAATVDRDATRARSADLL